MGKENKNLRVKSEKAYLLVIIIFLLTTACSSEFSSHVTQSQIQPQPDQLIELNTLKNEEVIPFTFPIEIKFEHLSVEDGLSSATINCIFQDTIGFIWICTSNGLNRFDGYNFKVYQHDPEDPKSLSNNLVTAISEDSQGVLWIGTDGGGLNKLDRALGQFSRFLHDPQDLHSLSNENISAIIEDSDGMLWIGTKGGGLVKYDHEKDQFFAYRIGDSWIVSILEDNQGALWVGTNSSGLVKVDRETGKTSSFFNIPDDPNSLSSNLLPQAIFEDRAGNLWIGTFQGLNKFSRKERSFIRYMHNPEDPSSLSNDKILAIADDPTGTLWIGTAGGLDRFDPTTDKFIHYQKDPLKPNSLSNNLITSIFIDRSGVLWIGTSGGGLNRGDRFSERFSHYQNDPNNPNSLNNNMVNAIYQDKTGMLWVGTLEGLNKFDLTTSHWTVYTHDPENPRSLSDNWILSIYEDRDGILWIGTTLGGLNRYDAESDSFTHYQYSLNDPHSLNSYGARVIYQDRSGDLWIGTNGGGLDRFDPMKGEFTHFVNNPTDPGSLSNNWIYAICEDQEGALWIGTLEGGLNRFNREKKQFIRYLYDPDNPKSISANFITSVYEDSSGTLWIGTANGLNRYNPTEEDFTLFTEKHQLLLFGIGGILEDDQGYLWLSTDNGVAKFDPYQETFKFYTISDGLQGNLFNTGAYFKNEQGEMFFGGANGYNKFSPSQIVENSVVPPIVLTSLTQNGYTFKLDTVLESVRAFTLYRPNSFFEFEFAALNYFQPDKNQYTYILEGFDKDWIRLGNNRYGKYTNLPGGNYTLRLKGSNNDGLWNDEGIAIQVMIVPMIWERWWFWLVIGLLLSAGSYSGYRLRIRSLEARSKKLESQVEERTEELSKTNLRLEQEMIERKRAEKALAQKAVEAAVAGERSRLARDLHDSVTQSLYGVTLYAEAAQRMLASGNTESVADNIHELRQTARDALGEMRLLVFELRPPILEEEGLAAALQNRLDVVERRVGLSIDFTLNTEGRLTSNIEEGLYRIAQEALNNILKHSQANRVDVNLGQAGGVVLLEISDDGIGFDLVEKLKEGGLGLAGMYERAEIMGGRLTVESNLGEGTRIRVEVQE